MVGLQFNIWNSIADYPEFVLMLSVKLHRKSQLLQHFFTPPTSKHLELNLTSICNPLVELP
jgi:hypothetical protein